MFVLRQSPIEQGAADAAVAIFEGVDQFEPYMGESGTKQSVQLRRWVVVPREEAVHFLVESIARWSNVVNAFTFNRSRHDAHRILASQVTDAHLVDSRTSAWKERCLPSKQLFQSQRVIKMLSGVKQNIRKPLDRTCGAGKTRSRQSQPPCERTA